jgi:leucyl aminopeptidase
VKDLKSLMKKIISSVLLCAGFSAQAVELPTLNPNKLAPQQYWITVGQDAMQDLKSVGGKEFLVTSVANPNSKAISIAKIDERQMNKLSRLMHTNHNRCGGYMVHTTLQSALLEQQQSAVSTVFTTSALSEATTVNALLPNLNKNNIVDTINYLSTTFNNRYHTTSGGSGASDGLKARWEGIVAGKSWASVTQVSHSSTPQKSVLVTLTGSTKASEIVVVGGHLDSTIGGSHNDSTVSPGADDDASGIATLTEVLRVYVENNVQPKRTVKFYAYAAEEVGLRGSKEIADAAAAANLDVKGVMQLDMTNYDGSVNDITFMDDYTNVTHTTYIKSLLDTYLPNTTYGDDSCGYGCSDHASWTSAGFPASMPFETRMSQYNQKIHTANDTLANMDSTAAKALKFAEMGLAYVVEMAAGDDGTTPPPTGNLVLENGVAKTNIGASSGTDVVYTMDVPAGATAISFTMSGGSGDADMYVKFGATPTDNTWDCRPYKSGNGESCTGTSANGKYYVRLKAYNTFAGASLVGSFTADTGGGGGLPAVSENHTNLSVASGGWTHFTQELQAGYASLNVTMSGGSGDADLYTRHGAQPTSGSYDCRPWKGGNSETCTHETPAAGTWHISANGYSAASNFAISWTATE